MFCRPNYAHDEFFNAFKRAPRDLSHPESPIECSDKRVLTELASQLVADRGLWRTGCSDDSSRRSTGKMTDLELFDVIWELKKLLPRPRVTLPHLGVEYEGWTEENRRPSSSTLGCQCSLSQSDVVLDEASNHPPSPCRSCFTHSPDSSPFRGGRKSKDALLAKHHNLPVNAYHIVHMPLPRFMELVSSGKLTEKQQELAKLIRKRGKNRAAARSCRAKRATRQMALGEMIYPSG